MNNKRIKYVVDKDNDVVVAEIKNCYFDAECMMNEKFIPNVTSGFRINNNCQRNTKFDMNRNYKAVAHLHPDDEWNEQRGKAVATDKLTETYHNSMNKRLAQYADSFRKIADSIDKYLAKQHN
jgi:hypothetical protein